jgi:hypothetical protein
VRLCLIEIARIEANTVGRAQFPVVNVPYIKAAACSAPAHAVIVMMAHVNDPRRRLQFGGGGNRDRRYARGGSHAPRKR